MQEVRVEKLVKRFGDVVAVDGISFEVPKGKMLTLLGPSGCGKTTTLNMIAGFENPDGGDVYVGDRLISSASQGVLLPAHKRNLGMVFQSYGLWPHMRVRDNVAFGLKMRGVAKSEAEGAVERALCLVRLDGMGDRYPSQLSGGQQQRVAFARALVYEPDVLLLDEPLSNLDAALREEMRLELKELQTETGITTIFVTHDQVEAMVMSDIIVVMNNGRIEQMGAPRDIYEHPANQFVAGFIGVSNFLEGEVCGSTDQDGLTSVSIGGDTLFCKVDGLAKGTKVVLSIRPEDWLAELEPPKEARVNALKCDVEKAVYMGGVLELWLKAAGEQIRVQGHRLPMMQSGESVYISVNPEFIKVVEQKANA
ncbi:MAG: ABC transporter ATP-binding protein [Proteobacteria bacterium]|nr:ABC transporter ATP-binding protein [Pseudomonadota bacterium]